MRDAFESGEVFCVRNGEGEYYIAVLHWVERVDKDTLAIAFTRA